MAAKIPITNPQRLTLLLYCLCAEIRANLKRRPSIGGFAPPSSVILSEPSAL